MQLLRSYLILFCLLHIACSKSETDASSENFIETQPAALVPITKPVSSVVQGYYQALPAHYNESGKKYPLLVFIHGGGQFGDGNTDLPVLLNEGIPELLAEHRFPPSFRSNDKNYSFVVLIPQFTKHPLNEEVRSFIDYALSAYRIDASRIYISGISNGGMITCDVAAEYPLMFAAIVPIAGAAEGNVMERCKRIAEAKLPVWQFHNDNDEFIDIDVSKNFISAINGFQPLIVPKFTIFPAFGLYGHDAWTKATDPGYKEGNMNIYEWMLQHSR